MIYQSYYGERYSSDAINHADTIYNNIKDFLSFNFRAS